MLDREGVDGDVIEGDWRGEMYRGPITDVGRLGSNNPTVRADVCSAEHSQRLLLFGHWPAGLAVVTSTEGI
ncbi:unnamed protein product [Lasius platythorax]